MFLCFNCFRKTSVLGGFLFWLTRHKSMEKWNHTTAMPAKNTSDYSRNATAKCNSTQPPHPDICSSYQGVSSEHLQNVFRISVKVMTMNNLAAPQFRIKHTFLLNLQNHVLSIIRLFVRFSKWRVITIILSLTSTRLMFLSQTLAFSNLPAQWFPPFKPLHQEKYVWLVSSISLVLFDIHFPQNISSLCTDPNLCVLLSISPQRSSCSLATKIYFTEIVDENSTALTLSTLQKLIYQFQYCKTM